jgi:hypothetical protein
MQAMMRLARGKETRYRPPFFDVDCLTAFLDSRIGEIGLGVRRALPVKNTAICFAIAIKHSLLLAAGRIAVTDTPLAVKQGWFALPGSQKLL